jgi:RNA recognition motif-containing protein
MLTLADVDEKVLINALDLWCGRNQEVDQVDPSVHLSPKGKRKTATLYVGNLDFNANEQDLRQALDRIFKRIRVDKITIPRVDGRSKYGFIEISWANHAPVKLADPCIKNSGMIQVNSRPIYFRELRNKDDKN